MSDETWIVIQWVLWISVAGGALAAIILSTSGTSRHTKEVDELYRARGIDLSKLEKFDAKAIGGLVLIPVQRGTVSLPENSVPVKYWLTEDMNVSAFLSLGNKGLSVRSNTWPDDSLEGISGLIAGLINYQKTKSTSHRVLFSLSFSEIERIVANGDTELIITQQDGTQRRLEFKTDADWRGPWLAKWNEVRNARSPSYSPPK